MKQCDNVLEKLKEYMGHPQSWANLSTRCGRGATPCLFCKESVVRGQKKRYSIVERSTLAILVTVRRLRHYFQRHENTIRTNLLSSRC